jgi:hypothetical protein
MEAQMPFKTIPPLLIASLSAQVDSRARIPPQIRKLKSSFNDVLQEMYTNPAWYEIPVRHGNVILMRKIPDNPED